MLRIAEREKKAERHGIWTRFMDRTNQTRAFDGAQGLHNRAVRGQSFFHSESSRRRHQRFGFLYKQVVQLWARLPPDFEHIFKACGGHQRYSSAAPLKKSVCAYGSAAHKIEIGFTVWRLSHGELDRVSNCFRGRIRT